MRQGFNRPDVPESPPAHYTGGVAQAGDVTLTKEAKVRAAKKSNRIGRVFMVLAIASVGIVHSLPVFIFLFTLMVAVNFAVWRYYLGVEREAATELALHARSLDEE
ncbi:MAG TPA: hypothetical protein VGG72_28750 [Bryobacteraceae bacterium]|jgi:hypothetical protein